MSESSTKFGDNFTDFYPLNNTDARVGLMQFELTIALLVTITFGITIIVGIVGNLLVLFTILLQKKMRSPTNILIMNLAIAELSFIVLCVPFTGLNYLLP
jgi:allatostatin A receptor